MLRCGTSEPGTAASASRKSSTSAVRIEVSCRQAHRASSSGLRAGGRGSGGWSRARGAGQRLVDHVYTAGTKPLAQICSPTTMSFQAPVTSSTPMATSIAPPVRMMAR